MSLNDEDGNVPVPYAPVYAPASMGSHFLAADSGWTEYRFEGGDPLQWREQDAMPFRVLAWEFLANGLMRPRTAWPHGDCSATVVVLRDPTGVFSSFHYASGHGLYARSLGEWLDKMKIAVRELQRDAALLVAPVQGNA